MKTHHAIFNCFFTHICFFKLQSFLFVLIIIKEAMLCACWTGTPSQLECSPKDNKGCSTGQICIHYQCHKICKQTEDCAKGQACINDICQSYQQKCQTHQDCESGWFCANEQCQKDLLLGTPCNENEMCAKGFCVDSVCCSSACDQICEACHQNKTQLDSGTCHPIFQGTDPDNECLLMHCERSSGCDGLGACQIGAALGSSCNNCSDCASSYCVDDVCCDHACDGLCEACLEAINMQISGVCTPIALGSDPEQECADDLSCSGLATCQRTTGEMCQHSDECLSSFCANSICSEPPELAAPKPYFPWNGYSTGTFHNAKNLKPEFRWQSSTGGIGQITYQLQISDQCEIGHFSNCKMTPLSVDMFNQNTHVVLNESLTINASPPFGRRYYWRVRACDSLARCSVWSYIRYFDAGLAHQDFNGDGYTDVAIATPSRDFNVIEDVGIVYLYLGSASGFTNSPDSVLYSQTMHEKLRFGSTVASGDVNHDGYSDLLVTIAPDASAFYISDRIYVYLGSAQGLSPEPQYTIFYPENIQTGYFGFTIKANCDINADGRFDVIVSAPFQNNGAESEGNVFVYYGRDVQSYAKPDLLLDNPDNQANGLFGWLMQCAGDLNQDGLQDFIISAPQQGEKQSGEVFVYLGDYSGLSPTAMLTLENPDQIPLGAFGEFLDAQKDINNDGFPDIIVGAHANNGYSSQHDGAVYVYLGKSPMLSAIPSVKIEPNINPDNLHFGRDVLLCDLNQDLYSEIIIGQTSDENELYGQLYVFSFDPQNERITIQNKIFSPSLQSDALFTHGLSCIPNSSNTNHSAVLVSAGMLDVDYHYEVGQVYYYTSNTNGLTSEPSFAFTNPLVEDYTRFGSVLLDK